MNFCRYELENFLASPIVLALQCPCLDALIVVYRNDVCHLDSGRGFRQHFVNLTVSIELKI